MTKIKIRYLGDFRTECTHESGAKLTTDAPKDHFGKGMEFSPTDLFATSLASCMLTIMAIAARNTGVDLSALTAEVEKEMVNAPVRRIGRIVIRIRCPELPNEQMRQKLEKAAAACPVHHSLHPDVKLEYDFVWGI